MWCGRINYQKIVMDKILVINSGSATLKFKIFASSASSYGGPKDERSRGGLKEELCGEIERIGMNKSFIQVGNKRHEYLAGFKNHATAFVELAKLLKDHLGDIKYVGNRIVHGGGVFSATTRLNKSVLAQVKKFSQLAPLHDPINIACAEKALEILPKARHYFIFDTAYYRTLPEYVYTYAIPLVYRDKYAIRKYGFHGISHQYAAMESARVIKKPLKKLKIITCHLGSGCSITATKDGHAIGTTMGFTPLEGLMMSTRSGDIDAAVPLYMIEQLGMTAKEIDTLLNKKSGLIGIAGTMDMREILAAAGKRVVGYKVSRKFTTLDKKNATLALDMFVYNIVRYIGQFTAVMGGVDVISFTGGVGERSPVVRDMVLKAVRHLGNFKSLVIPANEELMMAQEIFNHK